MKNEPQFIYLQIGQDCPSDVDFNDLSEITWASGQINKNDIVYQRLKTGPMAEENKPPKTVLVRDLDLSVRAFNLLMNHGITTVNQLAEMTSYSFLRLRGSGKKSMTEIENVLETLGLYFKDKRR